MNDSHTNRSFQNLHISSDIKQAADCVNPKIGQCGYRTTELRDRLNLNDPINVQVAASCDVRFGAQQQQPTTTTPTPTRPTTGQTTGAEDIQPLKLLILLCAMLIGVLL